mgnify:CR=1 FL=1
MGQARDFPFDIEDITELLRLRIRRRCADGVYTDCPFCGDSRGKMKINYVQNVWRCNYCGEGGGMLMLYAKTKGITTSEAYREICDAVLNGVCFPASLPSSPKKEKRQEIPQSARAENSVIHQTLTGLLGLLKLSERHREHLRTVRGLTDEQIDRLGYKTTPPFYMCRQLTDRLIAQGHTVEGVPGFYQKDGQWTVLFSSRTAGILIPVRSLDRQICGCQIRLDTPLKNEDDPPEKSGAKYIWLSSSGKPKGTSSGSPVHFVGDSNAGVVYVTEGFLKSDVAHYLMNRTFVATAGANNTAQLEVLLKQLADNGTHTIIEAEDMDKYRNQAVNKGALKLYELAKKYGMECRGLNWNPNYKGIDDWQLALRQSASVKEDRKKNFKQRFVYSLCHFDAIDDEVESWHENTECECELHEHLGLTSEEYSLLLSDPAELERRLLSKRQEQKFRIYQLDISLLKVIPFAFGGLKDMQKYHEYPPAAEYRLVHEGTLCFDESEDDYQRLMRIAETFGNTLPSEYRGRSVAPSDVLELYDETGRRYFYRDTDGFCPVKFSPMLAKK